MNITKRVGVVALGTALGQGSIVLATPILARIYTPDEFGELALFLTVASYAAALACLRYDLALSSASEKEAPALFWLCMLATMGVAVATLLVASLPWMSWSDSALVTVAQHPVLLALTVGAVGLHQAAASRFVRAAQFARLAVLRAAQGLLFAITSLVAMVGLVVAVPVSFAGAAALAFKSVTRVRVRDIVAVASRHRSFPLLSLPGALFDVLACSAVVLVISASYGMSEVGHFSQIQRFVGAPLLLVSASLFQVFLRQSADQHQAGISLAPLVIRVGSRVAALAGLAYSAVVIFGEPVLGFLLGPEWRVDRYFLATVVGGLAIRVCVSPFSSVLFTTGRLTTLLGWQFAYFLTSFGILLYAADRLSFDAFLAVYLVHEAILYVAYMGLIFKAARYPKKA